VVEIVSQTSENTAHVHLPRKAKAGTYYAERKVHLGDPVESDASKYSPQSRGGDEDDDLDRKLSGAKTKSPSNKELVLDVDEEEDNEEEVNII
jgi:hypothetical protein